MPEYTLTQSDFSAGVIDPLSRGSRTGALYLAGLGKADNVLFWPTGAVYRRRGTTHARMSVETRSDIIKTFTFRSRGNQIFLLFSPDRLDIYDSDFNLSQTIIGTGYAAADIQALDVKASGNDVYIVHQSYEPRMLTSAVSGTMRCSWQDTGETLAIDVPDADDTPRTGIGDIWCWSEWELDRINFVGRIDFNQEGRRPGVQAFKGGRWVLGSSVVHPDTLWCSRPMDADGSTRYFDFTLADEYLHTLTSTTQYKVRDDTGERTGNEVTSSNAMEAPWKEGDVEQEYDKDEKTESQTAIVEDKPGEPKEVAVTVTTRTHVKTTRTVKVLDNHGVELTESDMTGSRMNWIFVQTRLLVGYGRSVWMDGGEAITPASFDLQKTLSLTTSRVQPVGYGGMVFASGQNDKVVYAIGWAQDNGGFACREISSTSRSLLASGIVKLAVAENETTVLFALCRDGTLAACSLGGQFSGWSKVAVEGGYVVGMDVGKLDGGDVVYLIVRRGVTLGLEKLVLSSPDDLDGAVYLDDFMVFTSEDETQDWDVMGAVEEYMDRAWGGGTHGEVRRKVSILVDGMLEAGEATLPEDGKLHTTLKGRRLEIGYAYASELSTLNPELPANGTSTGKRRQLVQAVAYLYKSLDFRAGFVPAHLSQAALPNMVTRDQVARLLARMDGQALEMGEVRMLLYGTSTYGTTGRPFTGERELPVTGSTVLDATLDMRVELPVPWCMTALTQKFAIREV